MEDAEIDEIRNVLENIEKENMEDDPEIIEWLKDITKEENQLIEPFLNMFIDDIKNAELTDCVVKVIR